MKKYLTLIIYISCLTATLFAGVANPSFDTSTRITSPTNLNLSGYTLRGADAIFSISSADVFNAIVNRQLLTNSINTNRVMFASSTNIMSLTANGAMLVTNGPLYIASNQINSGAFYQNLLAMTTYIIDMSLSMTKTLNISSDVVLSVTNMPSSTESVCKIIVFNYAATNCNITFNTNYIGRLYCDRMFTLNSSKEACIYLSSSGTSKTNVRAKFDFQQN